MVFPTSGATKDTDKETSRAISDSVRYLTREPAKTELKGAVKSISMSHFTTSFFVSFLVAYLKKNAVSRKCLVSAGNLLLFFQEVFENFVFNSCNQIFFSLLPLFFYRPSFFFTDFVSLLLWEKIARQCLESRKKWRGRKEEKERSSF